MPCDRHLGSVKSVKCPLLNGVASFPAGAFALAATLGVEVLSIFVIKQSSKKYTVYVKPVRIPDSEAACGKQSRIESQTRAFAGEISNILHKYPCQWFNFYEFWA
jgi:predicted LPLAT superfamily acyltransferase